MMLLAIDRESARSSVLTSAAPRTGIAISHETRARCRLVQDQGSGGGARSGGRQRVDLITVAHGAEGIAVSPDGSALLSARTGRAWCTPSIRARWRATTIEIEGAPGTADQLRRVRVSPDGRYLCVFARRQLRRGLRRRVARPDRRLPDAEGADGLRLCRRRRARLSVLPRRRGDARIRRSQRGASRGGFTTAAGLRVRIVTY